MAGKGKIGAIIVAAGTGSRMNADCPKQFIEVLGKPILYYTLKAFEQSKVDEVIVVTGKDYVTYVEKKIVVQFGFHKVSKVIAGGSERYESVYCGLNTMYELDYVLVHDGARPFVEPQLIDHVIDEVKQHDAVIVGVKAKDTVKLVDEEGMVCSTPNRNLVWNIQTPQAFEYNLLKSAYDKVIGAQATFVTDDSMVVEYATNHPIKVIEGSYRNIKITTPEDLNEGAFEHLW